ncbi:MAG: [protein-PII] uridylyltransferase [Thermodesulfobacteriota bacterium]|nr:[protein-PII] uridylyltransferase [Thermodesulfobacteriota bacterium]
MAEHALKTLDKSRKTLISRFLKGGEPEFPQRHAQLFDEYFCECFETSRVGPKMNISKNPYAIVALGGYGRREQCVFSDIDLLFLFKRRVPDEAADLVKEIVYPLWDLGLDVGHSTLSIGECIALAGEDFEVLTSLLDSRFICGMSILYSDVMEGLQRKTIRSRSKRIVSMLVENNRERHRHFGDSTYLLEPNIKEGQGGLRDYHTILWIARIKHGLRELRDLEYEGYLSHEEFGELTSALSFVWDVRNRLHQMAGRKCDQLHFEYQTRLARSYKAGRGSGLKPVERFLGELHSRMELIKQHHLMFLAELGYLEKKKQGRRIIQKRTHVKGLTVVKNLLNFTSPKAVVDTPTLLIEIFKESATLGIPLSVEARRVVKEFFYLVDDRFRSSEYVVKAFEYILITPAPDLNVLSEMLNTGFLGALIPDVTHIINRIQYDEYHLYPVAKHSLTAVQTLKTFGTHQDSQWNLFYGDLYREISRKKILLCWAALLHDVGKGDPRKRHAQRGSEIARAIMKSFGYGPDIQETIAFLVKEHLFLMKIATRRDINDEETAVYCARRIKDVKLLKMLYLLTVADSISTGPKAWNDWTEVLLRDLFFKVLATLEKGELASRRAIEEVETKKKTVLSSLPTRKKIKEAEALFQSMSPRYLLYCNAGEMIGHIELYNRLGDQEFVWSITKEDSSNTRRVTICARDRPGLFSRISGVFTLNNLNILDAQIYTWRNNIALDVFRVTPPQDRIFEEERWAKAENSLRAALAGTLELGEALREKKALSRDIIRRSEKRPHRVKIDNEISKFFTVVEVFSYDFPGLLFSITDVLYKNSLDVWIAKISTKVDQVVDVFYVRDIEGQKIDSQEQISKLKSEIEEVVADRLDEG